jgi:hypothetical protein
MTEYHALNFLTQGPLAIADQVIEMKRRGRLLSSASASRVLRE